MNASYFGLRSFQRSRSEAGGYYGNGGILRSRLLHLDVRPISVANWVAGIFGDAAEILSFIDIIKYASTRWDIAFLCLFRL
jgi:hypothetical protein